MSNLVYSVIGTGAIGGYYGAKLSKSGCDVHFLLHSDYEFVQKNGLQINSVDGSFHLDSVNAYSSASLMPKSDVVLVCLKTTNNHLLKELLTPLLKDDTVVVLIQNGIGVEMDVEKDFPGIQLVAGLAFICAAKTEKGKVDHQFYGSINLGNYSCRDEQRLGQIAEDFNSAGVTARLVEYNKARWAKAVWNMPFNGMTVALATQTDRLLHNPSTMQLVKEQMLEVIHAAQALGVKGLGEDHADKMIDMTLSMVPYSPSMKLDYIYKRPMEIFYLYEKPIMMAKEAGFAMPKLEMLMAELKFLQSSYIE